MNIASQNASKKGFTLVEGIIIIVVLGLVLIFVPKTETFWICLAIIGFGLALLAAIAKPLRFLVALVFGGALAIGADLLYLHCFSLASNISYMLWIYLFWPDSLLRFFISDQLKCDITANLVSYAGLAFGGLFYGGIIATIAVGASTEDSSEKPQPSSQSTQEPTSEQPSVPARADNAPPVTEEPPLAPPQPVEPPPPAAKLIPPVIGTFFCRRYFASTVDLCICIGICATIILFTVGVVALYGFFYRMTTDPAQLQQAREHYTSGGYYSPALALLAAPFLFALWYYSARTESSSLCGTWGKRLAGLRVTDKEGNHISMGRATMRFIGKILSILAASFVIGTIFSIIACFNTNMGNSSASNYLVVAGWVVALLSILALLVTPIPKLHRPLQDLVSSSWVSRRSALAPLVSLATDTAPVQAKTINTFPSCPHCGQKLQFSVTEQAIRLRCETCGKEFEHSPAAITHAGETAPVISQ